MNIEEIRAILKEVRTGQDGWRFVAEHFGTKSQPDRAVYIQVRAAGRDNDTGEPYQWSGRKWHVSPFATRSEVVATCLKAVLTALEHEARECFSYKGVRVFDPHVSVDALADLLANKKAVEVRPGPVPAKTDAGPGAHFLEEGLEPHEPLSAADFDVVAGPYRFTGAPRGLGSGWVRS